MNIEWIDNKFDMLCAVLSDFEPNHDNFFYEPTKEFYLKLSSGEERDLTNVITDISHHYNIKKTPSINYDWSLKMDLDTAGLIDISTANYSIKIPFYYVGKPLPLGSIIAHELTHAFLFSKGIFLENIEENELFTDFTCIYIGLVKLLLNGIHFNS